MVKKYIAALLSFLLIISITLGCAKKGESTTETKKEGKEITLMIPDWGAPTENMLKEFKDETGISVKVLPTAWDDIKGKVSTAAAGKKAAADVIEVDWSWTGEFQSAGWLEELAVDDETKADIPSLSYFVVNNKTYAMPYANGVRLAYMNKEMMNQAGITEFPKTWKEFDATMGAIKDKKIKEYPFLFPLYAEEKTTTSFMTLAFTRNNIFFNNDDTLNKESVLDTFKFLKENLDKGYIDPASVSTPGLDTFKGIRNAQGAFLIGPTSYVTSTNDPKVSKVVGQVLSIPIPGKDGEAKTTITFTEAVGVSTYSENKEAAKQFVKWFSTKKTQRTLNKEINNTPTRTSVLEEMIADGTIKTPGSLISESKKVTTPFPNGVPKYYTKMSTEIFNIINQFGQGKLTPEQAADQMEQKVNSIVKENK